MTSKAGLRAALFPIAFLLAIGAIVPTRQDVNVVTEHSFVMALHEFFVRGLHHGSDIAVTFGPWGFLLGSFHPATLVLEVIARLAFAVLGVIVLRARIAKSVGSMTAVAMIAVLAFVVHICWADTFFYFFPLLVLFEGFERDDESRSPLLLLLVAAGALLSLTKFPFMTMMVIVVIVLSLDELRRRRVPWSAIVYVASIAAFWLLARQRIADFLPYVRDAIELSMCNGEAGGMVSPLYQRPTFVPFVIAAIAFTVLACITELRRGSLRGVLFAGGWIGALLIVFKSAYVRADFFHIAPACGALLIVQFVYLAMRWRTHARWIRVAAIVPILLSTVTVHALVDRGFVSDAIDTVTDSTTAVVRMVCWPSFREDVDRFHTAFLAAEPGPSLPMRGDSLPGPTPAVFHERFTYEPRPVYVAYCVCSSRLSARNVRWLRETKPPTLLFDINPIDRQFPTLEDGAMWPQLLASYSVTGRLGSHLVLTRRDDALARSLVPIATMHARVGEDVVLPQQSDAPRFARMHIRLTKRGTLLRTLYKTPPLFIRVRLDDGSEKRDRLIRGMAENDFLLSPFIENRDAFAALMEHRNELPRVTSVRVESEDARAYESEYEIDLADLR